MRVKRVPFQPRKVNATFAFRILFAQKMHTFFGIIKGICVDAVHRHRKDLPRLFFNMYVNAIFGCISELYSSLVEWHFSVWSRDFEVSIKRHRCCRRYIFFSLVAPNATEIVSEIANNKNKGKGMRVENGRSGGRDKENKKRKKNPLVILGISFDSNGAHKSSTIEGLFMNEKNNRVAKAFLNV